MRLPILPELSHPHYQVIGDTPWEVVDTRSGEVMFIVYSRDYDRRRYYLQILERALRTWDSLEKLVPFKQPKNPFFTIKEDSILRTEGGASPRVLRVKGKRGPHRRALLSVIGAHF